eukprot:g3440.t1
MNRPVSSSRTSSKYESSFAPKYDTVFSRAARLADYSSEVVQVPPPTDDPFFIPGLEHPPRRFENSKDEERRLAARNARRARRRRRRRWLKFGESRSSMWKGGYSWKKDEVVKEYSARQQHPATYGVLMLNKNILDGKLKHMEILEHNPLVHPASYVTRKGDVRENPLVNADTTAVCRWLNANGLSVFIEYFYEQELDGSVLLNITLEDLEEIEEGTKAQQENLMAAIDRACDVGLPARRPPTKAMLALSDKSIEINQEQEEDQRKIGKNNIKLSKMVTPGETHFHIKKMHPAAICFEGSVPQWRINYSTQPTVVNPVFFGHYLDAPPPPRSRRPKIEVETLTKLIVKWSDPMKEEGELERNELYFPDAFSKRKSKVKIPVPVDKVALSSINAEAIGWPRVKLGGTKQLREIRNENKKSEKDNINIVRKKKIAKGENKKPEASMIPYTYVVDELPIGRPYRFRVKFRNEAGWGGWSFPSFPARTGGLLKAFVFTNAKVNSIGTLNAAVITAGKRLHRKLTSSYFCAIPKENTYLVSNVTKNDFVLYMKKLAWSTGFENEARSPQSHLFIFLSCMTGCAKIKGELQSFLFFTDTNVETVDMMLKTTISFDELGKLIEAVNARRKLVCLDVCHQALAGFERKLRGNLGTTVMLYGNPTDNSLARLSTSCGPGVCILSSCSPPFQPTKAYRRAKARALKKGVPFDDFLPRCAGYATARELEADYINRTCFKGTEYFKKEAMKAEKTRMVAMDGVNIKEREAHEKQMAKFERARKLMDAGGDYERAEISEHSSDSDNELLSKKLQKKMKKRKKKKKKNEDTEPSATEATSEADATTGAETNEEKKSDSDDDWEEDRIRKAKKKAKEAAEKAERERIALKKKKKAEARAKRKAIKAEKQRQREREIRLKMIPGWKEEINEQGYTVYINKFTGERRNDRPLIQDAIKVPVFTFFLIKGLAPENDSPCMSRLGIDCKGLCEFVIEHTEAAARSIVGPNAKLREELRKKKKKKKSENENAIEVKKDPSVIGPARQKPCVFYRPLNGLNLEYELRANKQNLIKLKSIAASEAARIAQEEAKFEKAAELAAAATIDEDDEGDVEVIGAAGAAEKAASVAAQMAAEAKAEEEEAEKNAQIEAAMQQTKTDAENADDEEYSSEDEEEAKGNVKKVKKQSSLPIAEWTVWLRGELCDEAPMTPDVSTKKRFGMLKGMGIFGATLKIKPEAERLQEESNKALRAAEKRNASTMTHRQIRIIDKAVADKHEEILADEKDKTSKKKNKNEMKDGEVDPSKPIIKPCGSAFWPDDTKWIDIRLGTVQPPHPKELPRNIRKGRKLIGYTKDGTPLYEGDIPEKKDVAKIALLALRDKTKTQRDTKVTKESAALAGGGAFLRLAAKAQERRKVETKIKNINDETKEENGIYDIVLDDNGKPKLDENGKPVLIPKEEKRKKKKERAKTPTLIERATAMQKKALELKEKGEKLASKAVKAKEEFDAFRALPEYDKQAIREKQAVQYALTGEGPPPSKVEMFKTKFKAVAKVAAKMAQEKMKTQLEKRLGMEFEDIIEKIPESIRPISRGGGDTSIPTDGKGTKAKKKRKKKSSSKNSDDSDVARNPFDESEAPLSAAAESVGVRLAALARGEGNEEKIAEDLRQRMVNQKKKKLTPLEELVSLEKEIASIENAENETIDIPFLEKKRDDENRKALKSKKKAKKNRLRNFAMLAMNTTHMSKTEQRARTVRKLRTLPKGSHVDVKCDTTFPVCSLPLPPPPPKNVTGLCSTQVSITIHWENPAKLDWMEEVERQKQAQLRAFREKQREDGEESSEKGKKKKKKKKKPNFKTKTVKEQKAEAMEEARKRQIVAENAKSGAEKPQWLLDKIAEREAAEKEKADKEAKEKAEADALEEAKMSEEELKKKRARERKKKEKEEKQRLAAEAKKKALQIELSVEQKHEYEIVKVAQLVLKKDLDQNAAKWEGAPILEFEFQKRGISRGNEDWSPAGTCPGKQPLTRLSKADRLLADEDAYNALWALEHESLRRRQHHIRLSKKELATGGGPSSFAVAKKRERSKLSRLQREAEEDLLIKISEKAWDDVPKTIVTRSQCIRCLNTGTAYQFRVRARNCGGWSPWSEPSQLLYTEGKYVKGQEAREQVSYELQLAADRGGDSVIRKLNQYSCDLAIVHWALGALCATASSRTDRWSVASARAIDSVISVMELHLTCPTVAAVGSQFIFMIWSGDSKYERKLKTDVKLMRRTMKSLSVTLERWKGHPLVHSFIVSAERITRKCLRDRLTYNPKGMKRRQEREELERRSERERAAEVEEERRRKRREKLGAGKYAKYASKVRAVTPNEGRDLIRSLMF